MDLWKEFEMSERIGDMWQELGISTGTAVIVLIVLYFIIKWAVKNGAIEAYKEIARKKLHEDIETNKISDDLGPNDDDVNGKT